MTMLNDTIELRITFAHAACPSSVSLSSLVLIIAISQKDGRLAQQVLTITPLPKNCRLQWRGSPAPRIYSVEGIRSKCGLSFPGGTASDKEFGMIDSWQVVGKDKDQTHPSRNSAIFSAMEVR